ncbi:MAG: zf-HC2 domain-containing protein [Actinomycetota bacterium]|nr:zf-HC2 domain-containing protein [Actinomycetota bacterium]
MSDPRRCDPQVIFELADGALGPELAREVRDHLEACPGCRKHYEKEQELNAALYSLEFAEARSVRPGVVMALPTRPIKTRLLWTALALALLLVASLALSLDGTTPAVFAVNALGVFWGVVWGFADVAQTILVAAGPVIFAALVVGALLDLSLAAALLWTTRRRPRAA